MQTAAGSLTAAESFPQQASISLKLKEERVEYRGGVRKITLVEIEAHDAVVAALHVPQVNGNVVPFRVTAVRIDGLLVVVALLIVADLLLVVVTIDLDHTGARAMLTLPLLFARLDVDLQ